MFDKKTDTHSYLSWNSNHPPQVVYNIPYGVGLRIRKLCSEDAECDRVMIAFFSFFLRRGYPANVTWAALKRAFFTSREYLLHYRKPKVASGAPVFTLQWNPTFQVF